MPVAIRAFFTPIPVTGAESKLANDTTHVGLAGIHEAPLLCVLPLSFTALGCLVLFFYASDIYQLLLPIAGR